MNQPRKTNIPAKLYKTKNRRLILRVLLNQPPLTTKQIHETLNAAYQSQNKIPSLLQTYRTVRQLVEGGVIKREKLSSIFHYSFR